MKKDLLNLRKANNFKQDDYIAQNQDKNSENENEMSKEDDDKDVQISQLDVDENQNIDDYKKKIDEQIEEIKKKLVKKYQFTKTIDEEAIKKNFENGLKECLESKKRELEEKEKEKKNKLKQEYKKKLEEEKIKIKAQYDQLKDDTMKEKMNQIRELEEELIVLKSKCSELKNVKLNSDSYSKKYENEIKKLEQQFENRLKSHASTLEMELNNKRNKLKTLYMNKKIEYENNLKKNMYSNETPIDNNLIKEKKNIIYNNHLKKLENFKEIMNSHFNTQLDQEKEKIFAQYNSNFLKMKENYENTKNMYEVQKAYFTTEQKLIVCSNLISKLKNTFENKNSIFKNLLDHINYSLRKKIKELESNPNIMSLNNKDVILNKLSDILTIILYGYIYDYLLQDLGTDKDLFNAELDDLIPKIEKIISSFNIDKKVQLSMLICNPNFNF